jgi:siroheme synthase (precorrin-2 oxidase/ferrochelatase)
MYAHEQVFKAKFRGEDVAVKVFVITGQDRGEVPRQASSKCKFYDVLCLTIAKPDHSFCGV